MLLGVAALGALLFFAGGAKAEPSPTPVPTPVPVPVPSPAPVSGGGGLVDVSASTGGLLTAYELQTLLFVLAVHAGDAAGDPQGIDGKAGKNTLAAVAAFAKRFNYSGGLTPALAALLLSTFKLYRPVFPVPVALRNLPGVPVYNRLLAAAGGPSV